MTLKNNNGIEFVQPPEGFSYPDVIVSTDYSMPPKSFGGVNSRKQGAAIVLNYCEYLVFRTPLKNAVSVSTGLIDRLYEKAIQIDQEQGCNSTHPSFKSLMYACKEIVSEKYNPIFFNSLDALKMYIHRYGAVLVEFSYPHKLESGLRVPLFRDPPYNFNGSYFKTNVDTNEYFSKLFIAYGYNSEYILVANSLSEKWGSLGFIKIKTGLFNKEMGTSDGAKFFIKGGVFENGFGG